MDALGGTDELNKIAQALYPIIRINKEQDGDLLHFAFTLKLLFESLGYRKERANKIPNIKQLKPAIGKTLDGKSLNPIIEND